MQRLDASYALTQTAFLQRAAAETQVERLQAKVDVGAVTLDLLLDAQRREADAERAFFQSLLQYNLSILEVHYRKGSLLEYCGVGLQEGPWPAKAYFDALVLARQRDASHYFNYGYTTPAVVSRGSVPQNSNQVIGDFIEGRNEPTPAEPIPAGSSDSQSLPTPPGEAGQSGESAEEQLRSAVRFALQPDRAEGPTLNPAQPLDATPPTVPSSPTTESATSDRFDWDGIFE